MKAKLIRDDLEVAPNAMPASFVAAHAETRQVMRNGKIRPVLFWRAGTVLTDPQAFYLVLQGCAVPADEECAQRCDMQPEQMEAAQHAYERLSKGIHPEDFALFDAGIIAGYTPDGKYQPGPNAAQHPDVFVEPEEDEDDDE